MPRAIPGRPIGLALIVFLAALTAAEQAQAGWLRRCGRRRIVPRAQSCQPVTQQSKPVDAAAPAAVGAMTACNKTCLESVIATYKSPTGACLYRTYLARVCPNAPHYLDGACSLVIGGTCSACGNGCYSGLFGSVPTTTMSAAMKSAEQSPVQGPGPAAPGRQFQRELAEKGVEGFGATVETADGYTAITRGRFRLQQARQRVVELTWVHPNRDPNSGFGAGFQVDEQPGNQPVLPARPLPGSQGLGWVVACEGRDYVVFVNRGVAAD